MVQLVGLSGKAGAGKSFFGRHMRRYGFYNLAFSWALKREAYDAGWSLEELFVTKPHDLRGWLQNTGSKFLAHRDDYFITELEWLLTLLSVEMGLQRFVVTDVRYPNEANWIREQGGIVIRITHGMTNPRPYLLAGSSLARHASETALDSYSGFAATYHNDLGKPVKDFDLMLFALGVISQRPAGV